MGLRSDGGIVNGITRMSITVRQSLWYVRGQDLILASAKDALIGGQHTDEEVAHLLDRVSGVTCTMESNRSISSSMIHDHIIATGVLAQEVSHIIDAIIDDNPTIVEAIVLGDFFECYFRRRLQFHLRLELLHSRHYEHLIT